MTIYSCPCAFECATERTFSTSWYLLHRDHHLATFPDVDARTREVLDELVERAGAVAV